MRMLAGTEFGLATTTRKSNSAEFSSDVFASAVGQYSQPTYERVDSASPHASAQYPVALQLEPHSAQSRPVTQPPPSGEQNIDTVPSQRREFGRQSTHPSAGSHALSHIISLVRLRPSSPHW
jgi:hypothetical protein